MTAPDDDAARIVGRALRAALAMVGLSPWLVPLLRASLPLGRAGVLLDAAFATMCHRLPERSLALAGVTMPLCSRCAGIFGGVAVGALIAWPRASRRAYKLAITAAGLAMLADVITQDLGIHPVWHATRVATGLAFGYALGAAIIHALSRDVRSAPHDPMQARLEA
ncbi:MAG: DUF2085 domain-containing protein [Minicystis sp.]